MTVHQAPVSRLGALWAGVILVLQMRKPSSFGAKKHHCPWTGTQICSQGDVPLTPAVGRPSCDEPRAEVPLLCPVPSLLFSKQCAMGIFVVLERKQEGL